VKSHESFSVVHEGGHQLSPAIQIDETSGPAAVNVEETVIASPTSLYSKMSSTRPPSVATFAPFQSRATRKNLVYLPQWLQTQNLNQSYSATLSMFNFYSNPEEESASKSNDVDSRQPTSKRARRQAFSFSHSTSTSIGSANSTIQNESFPDDGNFPTLDSRKDGFNIFPLSKQILTT